MPPAGVDSISESRPSRTSRTLTSNLQVEGHVKRYVPGAWQLAFLAREAEGRLRASREKLDRFARTLAVTTFRHSCAPVLVQLGTNLGPVWDQFGTNLGPCLRPLWTAKMSILAEEYH